MHIILLSAKSLSSPNSPTVVDPLQELSNISSGSGSRTSVDKSDKSCMHGDDGVGLCRIIRLSALDVTM